MFYKLRNIKTNATMFYPELSDYLFYKDWRIEREASASEVDPFEIDAIEYDMMQELFE